MKKSICQSGNVISCYANEIEMKGFNAKEKNKKKQKTKKTAKKGKAKQNLIQDENKTKFGMLKLDNFSFGKKGS